MTSQQVNKFLLNIHEPDHKKLSLFSDWNKEPFGLF